MNFTGEEIRKGTSDVGDFQLEYSFTFVNDAPRNMSVRVYKDKKPVGQGGYMLYSKNANITFESDKISSADRIAVYEDFEMTIQNVFGETLTLK